MFALTLSSLLVASLALVQSPPAPAQSAEAAVVAELTALRKSVDQLVEMMKLSMQQAADRDATQLLSQLMEMDERRITQMQQRLSGLQESRTALDKEMTQMRASVDTYSQMAAGDPTGRAQAMMEQEKAKTGEVIEQKSAARTQLDNQITQLEAEIADAKYAVLQMRQRLDQKIRITSQP
jgi:chromosome segregation ATPase